MNNGFWTYRIPQKSGPSVKANLTRGVFNTQGTGRFVAYLHELDKNRIGVQVECQKCHDVWWDTLADIEESGFANCEVCENTCYPVGYKEQE